MEERKPAKTPRTTKSEGKPTSRRSKAKNTPLQATFRHGDVILPLNPGQIHLMHVLATEFPGEVQGAVESQSEAELALAADTPGLGEFVLHQLVALGEQQTRFEALFRLEV